MFNSAVRLSRAASGAARQAILAKPELVSASIRSVNSIAEKPMHFTIPRQQPLTASAFIDNRQPSKSIPTTASSILVRFEQNKSSSTDPFQPSTKVESNKKFHDLVNQRAKALVSVLPQKHSNKLDNDKQQTKQHLEANFENEIKNLNMQITGLKELVKAWKKDLDCAKKLNFRKERNAINVKIKKAKEEEINLINKKRTIELTSEITELKKQLEAVNINPAKALKINKLATAEMLNKKINALETDLAILTSVKAHTFSNSSQTNMLSTPKTIEKKTSPTKLFFESKMVAPSKDKADFIAFSKEFTLLDKVSHALNVELSLAQKHLSTKKLSYCQELIVKAQNQLKQIDKFKTDHKQIRQNHINYLNILTLRRKESIALLKEKMQTIVKNEQALKTEIVTLNEDLEKTISAIDSQVNYLESIDLEKCDLKSINLETLENQQKLAESLYATILSKTNKLKDIQLFNTKNKDNTDIQSFSISINETEAQIIKSTEINRKIKEKFSRSIEKLATQSSLKQIIENKEEAKETEIIKQQAINAEITKLKTNLEEVMNAIEIHYTTLESTDLKKSNLEDIDTAKIGHLLELAEFLDAEISIKSGERDMLNSAKS